jgi:peptidoglycan/xylan/chitin deacetylase (PgdA/CDA1 family)
MHRFADAGLGVRGASIAGLRDNLAFLRRHRIRVASLAELLSPEMADQRPRGPSVVFTVDDGYTDFARVAAPVFAEFDCPVTVFLVHGCSGRHLLVLVGPSGIRDRDHAP